MTYCFRSWDGGQNWYAIDVDKEQRGEIAILGPAEQVYPGLRALEAALDQRAEEVMREAQSRKSWF